MRYTSVGIALFACVLQKASPNLKKVRNRADGIKKLLGVIPSEYRTDVNGKVHTFSGMKNKELWENIHNSFSRANIYTHLFAKYYYGDNNKIFDDFEDSYRKGEIPLPLSVEECLTIICNFSTISRNEFVIESIVQTEQPKYVVSPEKDAHFQAYWHYALYYLSYRKKVEISYLGFSKDEGEALLVIYDEGEEEEWFGKVERQGKNYFMSFKNPINSEVGWDYYILQRSAVNKQQMPNILQGIGARITLDHNNPLGFEVLCKKMPSKEAVLDKIKDVIPIEIQHHLYNKRLESVCRPEKWENESGYVKQIKLMANLEGSYEMYNIDTQEKDFHIHCMKCEIKSDFSIRALSAKGTVYKGYLIPLSGSKDAFRATFQNELEDGETENTQVPHYFTSVLVVSNLTSGDKVVLEGTYAGFTRARHPHCGRDMWIRVDKKTTFEEIMPKDYYLNTPDNRKDFLELTKRHTYLSPFFSGTSGNLSDSYIDDSSDLLAFGRQNDRDILSQRGLLGVWKAYSSDSADVISQGILYIDGINEVRYKGENVSYSKGEVKLQGDDLYIYIYGHKNATLNTVLHYQENVEILTLTYVTIGSESHLPVMGTVVIEKVKGEEKDIVKPLKYEQGMKEYEQLAQKGIVEKLCFYQIK